MVDKKLQLLDNANIDLLKGDHFSNLIINNSPIAYVILDKNFNILFSNHHISSITGYNEKEILNKKCYEFFGNGSICNNCPVKKCMNTGRTEVHLKCEKSKDGTIKYVNLRAVPLRNKNGHIDKILEIGVDKTEEIKMRKQMEEDFYKIIEMLSHIMGAKDLYTADHSENVKNISLSIAQALDLPDLHKKEIMIAASLHDIGKVGISDIIINKAGQLTENEYDTIKTHPAVGEKILSSINSFKNIKVIVRHHHERFDGKGYPDGLKGKEIPLEARIIALADSYDAMATDRSYRKAMDKKDIVAEIKRCSGTQFDPEIVDVFLNII